jgi:GxxExxY protein
MSVANLLRHEETGAIVGAAIQVQRTLGPGLLERTYQNALAIELRRLGDVRVSEEHPCCVRYRGQEIAQHRIDLLVGMGGATVVVEIKHVVFIDESMPRFLAVLGNYIALAGADVGLLLNFGHCPLGVKRVLPHSRVARA